MALSSSSVLLDTHVLLWILSRSKRLKEAKWLKDFSFWTVSPVSLVEIKFLQEIGRVSLDLPGLIAEMRRDEKFRIDDVSLEEVCFQSLDLSWTRDPFDRLLVAHSMVRSLPLGTSDTLIREKYSGCL